MDMTNETTMDAVWPYISNAEAIAVNQVRKDAKLAQNLGQLQSFVAVFPQECMG